MACPRAFTTALHAFLYLMAMFLAVVCALCVFRTLRKRWQYAILLRTGRLATASFKNFALKCFRTQAQKVLPHVGDDAVPPIVVIRHRHHDHERERERTGEPKKEPRREARLHLAQLALLLPARRLAHERGLRADLERVQPRGVLLVVGLARLRVRRPVLARELLLHVELEELEQVAPCLHLRVEVVHREFVEHVCHHGIGAGASNFGRAAVAGGAVSRGFRTDGPSYPP